MDSEDSDDPDPVERRRAQAREWKRRHRASQPLPYQKRRPVPEAWVKLGERHYLPSAPF